MIWDSLKRFRPSQNISRNGKVPFRSRAHPLPSTGLGHHTLHRVHSTHDNNDWLEEAFPQRVFINPLDARLVGSRMAMR